jgi:hypothetical protein
VNELRQDLEHDHWDLGSAIAVWTFVVSRAESENLQVALKRHTTTVLALLKPFARIERIEWITDSAGDDAAEVRTDGEVEVERVEATFETLIDVIEVTMWLDLTCVSSTGVEFVIRQGANLHLLVLGDTGSERIQLELSLDADIYSPRTLGRKRENQTLASLNGPRLAAFLRGVREQMGGTVRTIASLSYEDLATDEGFLASPARRPT